MKKMVVIAKFIGSNSAGYVNGLKYVLSIEGSAIRCLTGGVSTVVYASVQSFLTNWDIIDRVDS